MIQARNAPSRGGRRPVSTRTDAILFRGVLLVLVLVPVTAFWWLSQTLSQPLARPGAATTGSATPNAFDPRSLFQEQSRSFLPPAVAAIPAEVGVGPPVPEAGEAPAAAVNPERVKVANTGGIGAVLREEPPRGRQIGSLRDGTVLQVLERRDLGGDEWVRVKTAAGAEGWIWGRLVGPAQ